ncbi:origin recognition complex subunit 4 C-terminus-domain-containing protein [Pterulicium gracile]|uniref:Origin recognition complex subunit 4 C-terminus-domain-containing protein n=1 Tax=Pterulicium gracile TaxID=1884261 RepID=A0A5C3QEL3_9AGAR|nr:origin recognition complex subunit 4 C-terminus-domain-containing protein [Pterula gracilis]
MAKRRADVELTPPEPKRQLRSSKAPVDHAKLITSSPTKKRTSGVPPPSPTKPRGRPPSASPKKGKARAKTPDEEEEQFNSSEDELDCITEPETPSRRTSPRKHTVQTLLRTPTISRSLPKPNTRSSPQKPTKALASNTKDTPNRRSTRNPWPKKAEPLSTRRARCPSLTPRITPNVKRTYGKPRATRVASSTQRSPSPAISSAGSRGSSPPVSPATSPSKPYSTAPSSPKHSQSPSPKTTRLFSSLTPVSRNSSPLTDEGLGVPLSEGEKEDHVPTSDPVVDEIVISDESDFEEQEPEHDEPLHDLTDEDEELLTPFVSPPPSPRISSKSRNNHPSADSSSSSSPSTLSACLNAQKRSILSALSNPVNLELAKDEAHGNAIAYEKLSALINGSIERGETNSCLVIGARNSGKTQLVETCIANSKEKPIVIRLSGWAQTDERQALKEIAWQLTQQTGRSFLEEEEDEEDEEAPDHDLLVDDNEEDDEPNPFLSPDRASSSSSYPVLPTALPPAHRISSLISTLPSLPRPTIVILDALDLFALHTRQALLYCLFDMVQTSRPGGGRKGVAVVGVTTRVDVVTLFEKRVKSRFSGRVVLLGEVDDPETEGKKGEMKRWERRARGVLCPRDIDVVRQDWGSDDEEHNGDVDVDMSAWRTEWEDVVDRFLKVRDVREYLEATCDLVDDVGLLGRILIGPVLQLDASKQPLQLSAKALKAALQTQRSRGVDPIVNSLPYPALCLLIAFTHLRTAGHDAATFEMLFRSFSDQANASGAAPAFQSLISMRLLLPSGSNVGNMGREFVKYRCAVELGSVKKAVARTENSDWNFNLEAL